MTFDSSITSDITGRVWGSNPPAIMDNINPKFGDGCLYLEGHPGYVGTNISPDLNIINIDCTIECWFNTNVVGDTRHIMRGFNHTYSSRYSEGGYILGISNNEYTNVVYCQVGDGSNNTTLHGITTIQTGQWYHLAMVLNNGVMSLFLNGLKEAERTYNKDFIPPPVYIPNRVFLGRDVWNAGRHWQGYIDEFRMTKGIARYTENFKPPSKPFWHPNQ